MADGVAVCCRFRPANRTELSNPNCTFAVEFPDDRTVILDTSTIRDSTLANQPVKFPFNFDRVFPPNTPQGDVFKYTAAPLAREVMKGFNCTMFAYGQTGSGKTFTMMGDRDGPYKGIIPRLAEEIMQQIEQSDDDTVATMKLSYVEIYMEKIQDLLEPEKNNLRIREDARGVWIQDVTETYVSAIKEIMDVLAQGAENRAVAATNMNEQSSRSHSVFIMTIEQKKNSTGSKIISKLTLVDLAGSETVRKTGASGNTLKEAQHINKSLSALGNVINALTSGSGHIPYRDSKLTRLLSDSLGGNSKTCLVVTASPVVYNAEETLSTLRFGVRAKTIKNKPTINQEKSVAEYKALLEALAAKCEEQQDQIQKLKAVNTKLSNILKEKGLLPKDFEASVEKEHKDADANQAAVLHNIEVEKQLEFYQQESKEKDEAIRELQENLAEKENEIALLKVNKVQQDVFEVVSTSSSDSNVESLSWRINEQAIELDKYKQRVSQLENERGEHMKRIESLQQDNLELAQFKDTGLTPGLLASNEEPADILKEQQNQFLQAPGATAGQSNRSSNGQLKNVSIKINDEDKDPQDLEPQSPVSDTSEMPTRHSSMHIDGSRRGSLKTNYDVLLAALGRKCEQYISLQTELQVQTDKLMKVEKKCTDLEEEKNVAKLKLDKQVEELTKKLQTSEKLCQKLFQSGIYWQQKCEKLDKDFRMLQGQAEQKDQDGYGFVPELSMFPRKAPATKHIVKVKPMQGQRKVVRAPSSNSLNDDD